jgi:hypothetical protein
MADFREIDKELRARVLSKCPELCKFVNSTFTFTSVSDYKAILEKSSAELDKWYENFLAKYELLK